MLLWWKNDSHRHHVDALSDQWQHTHLLYIKHCSFSISLFLFSSTEGKCCKQLKQETLSLKSLYQLCIFFGTSRRKNITEIWQTILDCLHRKTQLWTVSLWILPSVGVWPEDVINITNKPSLTQRLEKHPLVCWIHPWIDASSMSPQACSTAAEEACYWCSHMCHL